jgi:hypothetical protein
VDKIYRYPRRRTALATLAGRLAGEFPIASAEMALVFHHLLSGHSAGADGARANPATVDEHLQSHALRNSRSREGAVI